MSAPVSKLKRRLNPTPLAFTQRRPFSAAAHESPLTLAIDRLANKAPKISDEQEDPDATDPPVPPPPRDCGPRVSPAHARRNSQRPRVERRNLQH